MGTHIKQPVKASGRKATKRKPVKVSKLEALRKAILIPVGVGARAVAHATTAAIASGAKMAVTTTVKVARVTAVGAATAACATGLGLKVAAIASGHGALATVKVAGHCALIAVALPTIAAIGAAEGAGNALKEAFTTKR